MHAIPRRAATDDHDHLASVLADAGCLVIEDVNNQTEIDRISAELQPHLDAAKVSDDVPDDFYPGLTRRVTALVGRAPAVHDLIQHPLALALCNRHLGPNCDQYQLHVTAALEVGPGARAQVLHREEDPFRFFALPRPNLVLAAMWALSDFTSDNGATRLVPGSHRWPADRSAAPDEIVAAEMTAGSVLVWLGGTLHGAGANITEQWRNGVILSYSLGWLRQEENQYLDVAPDVAAELSDELRALVGFSMHGGSLGFYDPAVQKV